MRVIGDIPHPTYKISVFYFNNRHTIKVEDGLLEQSYAFRDGSEVSSLDDAIAYVDAQFLQETNKVFSAMRTAIQKKSQDRRKDDDIEFDEIF